jgi:hypothetical protein
VAADQCQGATDLSTLFLALTDTANKGGEATLSRRLLERAAQETARIEEHQARGRAEVAVAETARQIEERPVASAALEAVMAMRQHAGPKIVGDQELVRAATVAAGLDQWRLARQMTDVLTSDAARLDALSRMFAAAAMQR